MINYYREKLRELIPEKSKLDEALRARTSGIILPRWLDQYSINLDLETPRELIDTHHRYQKVVFRAEIDETGNYIAYYERHGMRKTPGLTRFLLLQSGASYPASFAALKMRAYNLKDQSPLSTKVVDDTDRYKKRYAICLNPQIKQNKEFAVGWDFVWPHCCPNQMDSDTINLKTFAGGIDQLEHTLVFPFAVKAISLYKVIAGERHPVGSDTKITHLILSGKHHYSYSVLQPEAAGYVVVWETAP